ncbi:SURF1 family protein [Dyella silvatica]|uniref:SURF1 family protein n=1 Tax=Dyella silvatica TaxID=2992128 RepID=UPI0022535416|nr:SURF1 family protein [Dyella silvatica]
MAPSADEVRGPRGPFALTCLAILALVVFAGFMALGTWQVQRRAWKLDLIARVEQRVHALASAAPGPDQWPQITASDEYRHVRLSGVFLYDRQTLVWASTALGSGYWVMTPLRMSETHVFMRHNDPAQQRWYARDVQAMAAAHGLSPVAPYFVDADAIAGVAENPAVAPVGGLTVIAFPNNHLVYLLTWYSLALMVAMAAAYVGRHEYRLRRLARTTPAATR